MRRLRGAASTDGAFGARDGGACVADHGDVASEGVAVTRRMVGMECLVAGVPRSEAELARVVSAGRERSVDDISSRA